MVISLLLFCVSLTTSTTADKADVSRELQAIETKVDVAEIISSDSRLKRRKQCRQMRRQHKVIPGTSWGSMNREQQDLWISLQCDEFFCEPHRLAGKGVYKCIPLPQDPTMGADEVSSVGKSD